DLALYRLPRRRIRHQWPVYWGAGETWRARYRAGHRNQLDVGRESGAPEICSRGQRTRRHYRGLNNVGQSPRLPRVSANALRDLSHDRLINLDLLRGLHAFLHFLDVGIEVLLAPPWQYFCSDHIQGFLHFFWVDLLALLHCECDSLAGNSDGRTRLTHRHRQHFL